LASDSRFLAPGLRYCFYEILRVLELISETLSSKMNWKKLVLTYLIT
jgi:hypothetical protein